MKKLIITYNILFLAVGNILLSNIHFLHDHNHDYVNEHSSTECDECVVIEHSNHLVVDFHDESYRNDKASSFFLDSFTNFYFNTNIRIFARGPPIS